MRSRTSSASGITSWPTPSPGITAIEKFFIDVSIIEVARATLSRHSDSGPVAGTAGARIRSAQGSCRASRAGNRIHLPDGSRRALEDARQVSSLRNGTSARYTGSPRIPRAHRDQAASIEGGRRHAARLPDRGSDDTQAGARFRYRPREAVPLIRGEPGFAVLHTHASRASARRELPSQHAVSEAGPVSRAERFLS